MGPPVHFLAEVFERIKTDKGGLRGTNGIKETGMG